MSEQTQINPIMIGIDVAKDKLDICILPTVEHFVVKNDPKAISRFIKEFLNKHSLDRVKIVVMESTGGYEKAAAQLLVDAGLSIHIAHPNQVFHFAKSKRLFAKTDKIDAHTLALFGAETDITPTVLPSKEEQVLKELSHRQMQLKASLITEKCRLKDHLTVQTRKSILRFIKQIEIEIKLIEEQVKKLIEGCGEKKKRAEVLKTFKGIGEQTGYTLVAMLPELGSISRAQIAALVGLAPKNKDSGTKMGYRAIQGGRFCIRKALYMPALSAIRHNQSLQQYYQQLIGRGKKPKVAIVAVMRKMIITLNAMLKNNMSWNPAF